MIVWHPARARTDVTKPMMVVIFILLTFFFSIPNSNDTRYIYVSPKYHFVFWKLLYLSYDTTLINLVRFRFDFLMSRSFDSEIAEIYNERFLEFGPLPEASMWYSQKRQFARFDIILNQINLLSQKNKISVSDIGCGYGAFLEFLSERKYSRELHYFGYDVSDEVVKFCQKKYSKRASFYTGSIPVYDTCLLYTSPSPRDISGSRMPSSA